MGGKDVPKILMQCMDKGNKTTTQLKMGPTGLARRMPFFTRPTTMLPSRDEHNLKKRATKISHTVIRGGGKETSSNKEDRLKFFALPARPADSIYRVLFLKIPTLTFLYSKNLSEKTVKISRNAISLSDSRFIFTPLTAYGLHTSFYIFMKGLEIILHFDTIGMFNI